MIILDKRNPSETEQSLLLNDKLNLTEVEITKQTCENLKSNSILKDIDEYSVCIKDSDMDFVVESLTEEELLILEKLEEEINRSKEITEIVEEKELNKSSEENKFKENWEENESKEILEENKSKKVTIINDSKEIKEKDILEVKPLAEISKETDNSEKTLEKSECKENMDENLLNMPSTSGTTNIVENNFKKG